MTVSSTTTKNSYSGDGSTTVFAYTFKIFDEDDITVIVVDINLAHFEVVDQPGCSCVVS